MPNNKKIHQHIIVLGGFLIDIKPVLSPYISNINNVLIDFIDINRLAISDNIELILNNLTKQIKLLTNLTNPIDITIIAYSFGGICAIYCQKLIPNCTKLILINATPKFIEDKYWQGIKENEYNKLIKKLQNMSLENFIPYFIKLAYHPYPADTNLINYIISINYDKKILINLLYLMQKVEIINTLKDIKIPTIMIYSKYDILVPYNNLNNNNITAISIDNSSHLNFNKNIFSIILKYLS
jgi:pimeloyl-ACP methyl ester carboxylesterase